MTLPEIATTWPAFSRLSAEDQQMVRARLQICDYCPRKNQLLSGNYFQGPNDPDSIYYCNACGCGLFNKTKDPDNICPENNWKQYEPDDSFY